MHVIVVGAGEVGTHIAQLLSREGHDVTVVEQDNARVAEIDRMLDVSIVKGSATDPAVMRRAGVCDADLVVAATSSDDVNLVASLIAKLEGARQRVVRLERPSLRLADAAKLHEAVGADRVIDPDAAVAKEILDLLSYPGATEIAHLAENELLMVSARLSPTAPFVGQRLSDIAARLAPEWDFIVCTITRDGQTIVARTDQQLRDGDTVRIVCKTNARTEVMRQLGLAAREHHRLMILGGGRTGEMLARSLLAKGHIVSIIERNESRANELADTIDGALVLLGDITDGQLLVEEDIGSYDAVVALTGEDDANILACLFAKKAGARETIAVLHRLELRGLLSDAGVDVAISPRTASANEVLRTLQGGVSAVATSLDDDIAFYEVEIAAGSKADGVTIADLRLPHDTLVAAVSRDGETSMCRGSTQLQPGDHVVFTAHGKDVEHLRKVFAKS